MSEVDALRREHKVTFNCTWPRNPCSFQKEDWVHCSAHVEDHCKHCEDKETATCIGCVERK